MVQYHNFLLFGKQLDGVAKLRNIVSKFLKNISSMMAFKRPSKSLLHVLHIVGNNLELT